MAASQSILACERDSRGSSPRLCRGSGVSPPGPGTAGRRNGTERDRKTKCRGAERPRQGSLRSARPRYPPVPAGRGPGSHRRQPPAGLGAAGAFPEGSPPLPVPLRFTACAPAGSGLPSPGSPARPRFSRQPARQGEGSCGPVCPPRRSSVPLLPGKSRQGSPGGASRYGRGESKKAAAPLARRASPRVPVGLPFSSRWVFFFVRLVVFCLVFFFF